MKKGNYLIKLYVKSAIDSGGAGNTRKSPQFRGFEKRIEREINSLFLCEPLDLKSYLWHWCMILLWLFGIPDADKDQLISKGRFAILNSSKIRRIKCDSTSMIPPIVFFLFWRNWRHQSDISKLTDFYYFNLVCRTAY